LLSPVEARILPFEVKKLTTKGTKFTKKGKFIVKIHFIVPLVFFVFFVV
jgi:hypothetical protein